MICDGAKSSCALKVATAVSAGIQAALLLGTVSAAASLLTFCLSTREDSR